MSKYTSSIEETVSEMSAIKSAKDALEEYLKSHYQEIPYKKLKVLMKQVFEMEQIYEDLLSPLTMESSADPACNSISDVYRRIVQTNATNSAAQMSFVKMVDNRPVHQTMGARYMYKDLVRNEYGHCKEILAYLNSLEKPAIGSKRSMTTMLQTSHLKAYLSALKEIGELFELNLDD